MTHRERMLAALGGEPADRIPWAPRLDLWHRAHSRAGTLPAEYRSATLREMTDDLGWGYHAVVPDFRDLRGEFDDAERALCVYNIWTMPCRSVLQGVERVVTRQGDRTRTEYRTPEGAVTTTTVYDDSMRDAGITITHVAEHAFESPADYGPLGFIFENMRVEQNYDGYAEFAEFVGERGLAVGCVSLASSPMHLIQRELMPLDTFFFECHDHPEEMAELARRIGLYWDRLIEVAAASPAEVLFVGGNYDAMVTYPPFFAEHIVPTLSRFSGALHDAGKYLLAHTDGENDGLLEHYVAAGVDIADSVCPKPMTKLGLGEVRDCFDGRVTVMGGVPSVALLEESMPDAEFGAYLDRFFEEIGAGDHLILGVSDTTPPGAKFERLVEIARRVEEFGPVGGQD